MNKYLKLNGLIHKYALILIVLYLIQYGFHHFFTFYLKGMFFDNQKSIWIPFVMWGFDLILNLVAALAVASDVKKYQPKSKYLILLTIVYRPLGVCLLLISLVLNVDQEHESIENAR